MSKKGLPIGIAMRHDSHYVEELSKPNKSFGKIISINLLEPNPEQPRVEIGDLEELSQSILEKGILEPILVKPNTSAGTYMIIAGERRWRAAGLAGLREVPCIELDLDEQSIAEIALIENLQRKDLTIWEEADGLAALKNKFSYKHEDIAKKISKSRSTVTELLSIAGIPDHIRAQCRALHINSKAGLLEVARQFDEPAMIYYLDKFEKSKDSGRPAEKLDQTPQQQAPSRIDKTLQKLKMSGADIPPGRFSGFHETAVTSQAKQDPQDQTDVAGDNVFSFVSKQSDFQLKIVFNNLEVFDKKHVLRALKESFDEIKANL